MTRYQPQWLQAGSYAASQDRRLIGALWPAPASSGCAVTAQPTGMGVYIAAGQVTAPTANNTGSVLCTCDAQEVLNLNPAPPAGTDRYDVIICRPRGQDLDGGTNDDFIFDFVSGTAAASPTVPAIPAGTVALANVRIVGGSATVAAGNITDRRPGSLAVPPAAPANHPGIPLAAFRVTANGQKSIAAGVWTVLDNWGTPDHNIGGGTWNGTGYTIPHRGLYLVIASLNWNFVTNTFSGANKDFLGAVYIDGANPYGGITGSVNVSVVSAGSANNYGNVSDTRILNAGQVLDFRAFQNSAFAYGAYLSSRFEITELPHPV